MIASRIPHVPAMPFLLIGVAAVLISCQGDDQPSGPVAPGGPQGRDSITLAVDGGAGIKYVEASGLPEVACDPRVDWWANQVVLWHNFTGGSTYEHFFDIMFPLADSVGTYTVHGDYVQAFYHDVIDFTASPGIPTSDGTVQVTRSDDRIQGSFTFTVVDGSGTTSIPITGSFNVDRGVSLSCP